MTQKESKLRRVSAKSYMSSVKTTKKVQSKAPKATSAAKPKSGATSKAKATPKSKTPRKSKITYKGTISAEELTTLTQKKAYELYQLRGCQDGYDAFDWSIAEYIVKIEKGVINNKSSKKTSRKKWTDAQIQELVLAKAQELSEKRGYGEGQENWDWIVAENIVRLENNIS